jgi:hypothetical protein
MNAAATTQNPIEWCRMDQRVRSVIAAAVAVAVVML